MTLRERIRRRLPKAATLSKASFWVLIAASWYPFLGMGWMQGWAYALLVLAWHRTHRSAYRNGLAPNEMPRIMDRRQAAALMYLGWPWYVLSVTLAGGSSGANDGIWVMLSWQAGLLACILTWSRVGEMNDIVDRVTRHRLLQEHADDDLRWGRPRTTRVTKRPW